MENWMKCVANQVDVCMDASGNRVCGFVEGIRSRVCCVFMWCVLLCVVLLGSALLQPAEVPQSTGPEERSGTRQTGPHQ